MEKNSSYKDYSIGLALFDAVPVLLFLCTGVIVYMISGSAVFLAGALAAFAGGTSKVIWKLTAAVKGTDKRFLTRVFHILMPAGFGLMLLAVIIGMISDAVSGPAPGGSGTLGGIREALTIPYAALFFALGFAGMFLMGYLGKHLDDSVRSAWTEQSVNAAAQAAFLICAVIVYFGMYYHADADARTALEGSETVSVEASEDSFFFDGPGTDKMLVFYPGAKVEASAYAPLMGQLAEKGCDCCICRMPLNFALLGKNAAADIHDRYADDYEHWYIAGHSLGGAAASMLVSGQQDNWEGIIFLGAYPADKIEIPALSIYGSEDRVLSRDSYKSAGDKGYWPEDLEEYVINGGDHAQFGSYGVQKGDGTASVSAATQREETAERIISWINR